MPWDDKELKVSFATFRDTLRPGARETWRVKVEAPKGRSRRSGGGGAARLHVRPQPGRLRAAFPRRVPDRLYPNRTGLETVRRKPRGSGVPVPARALSELARLSRPAARLAQILRRATPSAGPGRRGALGGVAGGVPAPMQAEDGHGRGAAHEERTAESRRGGSRRKEQRRARRRPAPVRCAASLPRRLSGSRNC